MPAIYLKRLPNRPHNWDELIRRFSTKTFFHEAAWLDFLLDKHPSARIDYFAIKLRGTTIGYFCALRKQKFLVAFYPNVWFGTTACQAPVISELENQAEIISALISAARTQRVRMLNLRANWLDPLVMQQLGFKVTTGLSQLCPLPQDELSAWNAMKGTCRTRIRKAEKEGLVAEVVTDAAIVHQFYALYHSTLEAKGLTPTHPIDLFRALMERLTPADRLFAVVVKFEEQVIGVGLYACDERVMYYIEGAADPSSLHLCPNELLHWTAMKAAIGRGIPAFDIGGGPAPNRFSQKFGGGPVKYHECSRSLNLWAYPVMFLYETMRSLGPRIQEAAEAFRSRTGIYLLLTSLLV